METKKVVTRNNEPSNELHEIVCKVHKGLRLEYDEVYYLDYEVNEDTGSIDKEQLVKHYTKSQMDRNKKALKTSYHVAKGAASPSGIINFRQRYQISASTFSIVLGFSKNKISKIDNEGVKSLPTGRLIKMCVDNKDIVYRYIQVCDTIDFHKKEEISKRLLDEYY